MSDYDNPKELLDNSKSTSTNPNLNPLPAETSAKHVYFKKTSTQKNVRISTNLNKKSQSDSPPTVNPNHHSSSPSNRATQHQSEQCTSNNNSQHEDHQQQIKSDFFRPDTRKIVRRKSIKSLFGEASSVGLYQAIKIHLNHVIIALCLLIAFAFAVISVTTVGWMEHNFDLSSVPISKEKIRTLQAEQEIDHRKKHYKTPLVKTKSIQEYHKQLIPSIQIQ